MVGKNVFTALSNYVPREKSNPKENHFTEAFKFIIENDEKLLTKIIRRVLQLNNKDIGFIDKLDFSNVQIISQEQHETSMGRIISDIEIKVGKQLWIIIENKLGAKEGEDDQGRTQLEKYIFLLDEDKSLKNRYLFFITLTPENVSTKVGANQYYVSTIWSEIYEVIRSHTKEVSDTRDRYLLGQFVDYMGVEDMGAFEGFDNNDLDVWVRYKKFNENLEKFIPKLKAHIEKKEYVLFNQKFPEYSHGRILNFKSKKNPTDRLALGFWRVDKQSSGLKPGVYCILDYFVTNKHWPKTKEAEGAVYSNGDSLEYISLLDDVLGKEKDPEVQIEKLLAFYDKALTEILNSELNK